MQQSIKGQGLPTNCWPHVYLPADRDEQSFSQFRGDLWSTHWVLSCSCFLDWDYHYRSVDTQILHGAGFVLNPYTGWKSSFTGNETSIASCSMSWKYHALNHVTTGYLITILCMLLKNYFPFYIVWKQEIHCMM